MKRTLFSLAVIAGVLGLAAPSRAIDAKQFNCEKSVVVGLAKFSRDRGKCITTCVGKKQTKPLVYSCYPSFDVATAACAQKSVDTYTKVVTAKCTGNMPPCGGYVKGYCSDNTAQTCSRDGDCTFGAHCNGRCSATSATSCEEDADCPGAETCETSTAPKDILGFVTGNLFEGNPIGAADRIDQFSEPLFQCRQSVCTVNGDLCGSNGDCSSGTCSPGRCSDATPCAYDGDCGAGTTKKCLPLGRCAGAATACTADADCGGNGPCQRYGRCTGGTNNLELCFTPGDCPDGTGACTRTTTDTDRKVEQGCTKAVGDSLAKLTFDVANCQSKCASERDLKQGQRCADDPTVKCKLSSDCGSGVCRPTSCDPYAIGRCSLNPAQVCAGNSDCPSGDTCVDTTTDPISADLKACRTKAFEKALASINKKCPSLPTCGAYSVFGGIIGNFNRPEDLLGFVSGLQDGQFKEDNPDLSPGSNFCLQ